MLASFRNFFVQKRIKLQRPNKMQCQPRSSKLPQVLNSHATRIDFHPARFRGSNIIKFKSHLPPQPAALVQRWRMVRSTFVRLLQPAEHHIKPASFIKFAQPSHDSLPRPRAMRLHQRPVRCAVSILLFKVLSNKHSWGCYRRFSHSPDTKFSIHHVLTFQTRPFSKTRQMIFQSVRIWALVGKSG